MSVNLSFLKDSLDHRSLVGKYATYDLETFHAHTPALQEAVKYWKMPVKSTHELVTEEHELMLKYASEIEIVRQHLWRMHAERQLQIERSNPPTLIDRTFNVILSISPSTKRTVGGVACLIAGLISAFFLLKTLYNPAFCILLSVACVSLITSGVYLLMLSRRKEL